MIDPSEEISPEALVNKPVESKDIFYTIENLPTNYKLYPKGTVIKGRPLTVREVKKLSSMNENNFDSILNDVLTTATRGLDIEEIYVADKIYIIFWLRANTYKNANFTTPYVCQKCKRPTEYTFDVDAFEIKYLPDDFDKFSLTMLNKTDIITFDYSKIKDEIRVEKFNISMKSGLTRYDDETIQYASMIKTINGESVTMRSACEYLNSLGAEDSAYLQSYLSENDIGVIPVIQPQCGHTDCKEVNEVLITFRSDFFVPKYKFR